MCKKTCLLVRGSLRLLNSECGKIGGLSPIFRKKHTFFKVPCITLREDTEWVETIEDGWNVLVGANDDAIIKMANDF